MKDLRKSGLPLPSKLPVLLILPVLLLLLTALPINAAPQQDEAGFDGWYQIDVILFKPRSADLDDESWPEYTPEYPANVISVYPGELFKLSQLEQALDAGNDLPEPAQVSGVNGFAFENLSSRKRNRRIVEAATGNRDSTTHRSETTGATIEAGTSTDGAEQQIITDNDLIRELVQNRPTATHGQLAFADTMATSSLGAIRRSLRRSSLFDVIDHRSWVQPVNAEPSAILVQAGKRYDDRFEVEGTLSFSRSRYLHVETDLWYTIFEPRGGGDDNPRLREFESGLTDEQLEAYQGLVDVERERGSYHAARSHVMMQSRRSRSNELHYIDHPLFGVIVRINRYTP